MGTVSRRCVFYVSGFDPKGAAHYHGLYREESAHQCNAEGYTRTVGPRKRDAAGNAFGVEVFECVASGDRRECGTKPWFEFSELFGISTDGRAGIPNQGWPLPT